jgi:hypothetical protein
MAPFDSHRRAGEVTTAGSMPKSPQSTREQRTRRASPLRAISAVLGAFIGIRRRSAGDRDLASLKPVHVIMAGVIAAALFVIILVTLVNLIV